MARIADLGPDRLAVVNAMLLQEKPLTEVADVIQKEWNVFTEVDRKRLTQMLSGYKSRAIIPLQVKVAAKLTTDGNVQKLATLASEMEGSMDAMKELEATIRIQMARVEKMALVEQDKKGILKEQTRALALLSGQLERFANLQMDLGILQRVPKKLNISADVTEEELKFVRAARLHAAEGEMTMEAIRYLRGSGKLLPAGAQTVEAEIVERPPEETTEETPDV